MPDRDRDFCDAVERGDWRPAFFEELPRLYDLQDGLCDERRTSHCDCIDDSAFHNSVGAGESPATVDGVGIDICVCGARNHIALRSGGITGWSMPRISHRGGEPGRIRRTDGKFTGYASDGQTCEMGAAFE